MATLPVHSIAGRTARLDALWLEHELFKNPRQYTGLDAKSLDELGAEIKAKGMVDPPKVQRFYVKGKDHPDEVADLVVDGQRRILAARDVFPKGTEIPVVDLSEEPIELTPEAVDELLDKALTSLRHQGLSSYELSAVAEDMATRKRPFDVIGNTIGKSKTWVSRMLTARKGAEPKLLTRWRKGEITDEQFKELAEVADPAEQADKAEKVVEARKSGDRTEARILSKETKEAARAGKAEKKGQSAAGKDKPPTNGIHKPTKKPAPIVSGEQRELFASEADADAHAKVTAVVAKAPVKLISKYVLEVEEFLAMEAKRPPTADYVKGLMDFARHMLGLMEPRDFSKAWHQYVNRIEGRPRPVKKAKKAVRYDARGAKKALASAAKKAGKKKGKRS